MEGTPENAPPGHASRTSAADWGAKSTGSLLDQAQAGDERALEAILARYLPRLMRWASGRLPRMARDIVDTDDLVQDSLIKVVRTLSGIQARNPNSFAAYLRKAVLNRIRDEVRRAARLPEQTDLDVNELETSLSPLEECIGQELSARYEAALLRLSESDRAILFLKIEMGMDYGELAIALDKASSNAARMAVNRAGLRLAREMYRAR
jgi:RNA polymerase sigma-70 factor (ECF subfamily)